MGLVAAIGIGVLIVGLILAFFAGVAAVNNVAEEMHREFDDRDQEEYIRRWQEEKKMRNARKKAKRRKR